MSRRPSSDGPNVAQGGHKVKRPPVIHTRCIQVHVKDIKKNAVSLLSSKSAAGEIPLVLIPEARHSMSMFMEIPTGVHCLVQRFGKDIGVMSPGLHLLPSWYRVAYVVSGQSCCYDAPVLSCPTSDDIRVEVDVVLIFQIMDPQKFIYRLGAKNFDEFLSGTVDEAIRVLVRREDHKTVYALRGTNADDMLKMLNDKFVESGVTFLDVKVTNVALPDVLANSLELTTKLEKGMECDVTANEFALLQINMESEMQIEQIRRLQEQTLVSEAGKKRRAELEFEQRSVKAEEEGSVAQIWAKGKVEVDRLTAQTDLDRSKMRLETWRVTQMANALSKANSQKIAADLEEEAAVIQATWQEDKMMNDAEVTRCEADVEAEAIRTLAGKRAHDMNLREKEIIKQLASSGSFNLIGTSGDKLVSAMLNGTFSDVPATAS